MKEVVLITGANGMVARELSKNLEKDYTVRFLTRKKNKANEYEWDIHKGTIDESAFENISHVIHLAGANISEKRWSEERKKEIISSRIDAAKLILDTLKKKNIRLKSFISASAVGIYGAQTSQNIYAEDDEKANDFLGKVVRLWEAAADEFLKENIAERVVKIRTSIVLSEKEGALNKMAVPIKFGIGSPIGTGKQYMPWIHLTDMCRIYEFALKNPHVHGAYNSASPQHTTNENFTEKIAEVLHKPLFMPNIPAFILKLLFGELSVALLEGSRVDSQKIQDAGFQFQYPDLKNALQDLLKK
ncbi:TIGR01777 family oxidoreductase [Chryseobacterium paridis]|uniref:TIGR01777 family oxidoreductase n=1 Tax=Chryseobacterium paridis TaxID=2800328 RepID=A0ABS1FWV8_9FLAO|nr:TIGR01777 family oxidoreductase [Chryseobacterium paridis]MBK1896927.1 TIGR01777 family oxidoreductase [Chryseobacterium paridis]